MSILGSNVENGDKTNIWGWSKKTIDLQWLEVCEIESIVGKKSSCRDKCYRKENNFLYRRHTKKTYTRNSIITNK